MSASLAVNKLPSPTVLFITDLFPTPNRPSFAGIFVTRFLSSLPPRIEPIVLVPIQKKLWPPTPAQEIKEFHQGYEVHFVEYRSALATVLHLIRLHPLAKVITKKKLGRRLRQVAFKLHAIHHFQLVHGIELFVGDEAVPIAKKLQVPSVLTIHSLFSFLESLHGKFALKAALTNAAQASAITTVSHIAKNSYPASLQTKITVIPNGYTARAPGALSPEIDHLTAGKLAIVTAGWLIPSKKFDVLLRAFAQLPSATRDGAVIILIGNGPEKNRLRQLTQTLAIGSNIVFIPEVHPKDMPAVYTRADLVIQPSANESFSMICLEAMAYGKPFICTSAAGIAEYITSSQEGFVVEPNDLSSLTEALSKLLADQTLRQRMGQHGRQTAQQFRTDRIAEKYFALYSTVLAKHV